MVLSSNIIAYKCEKINNTLFENSVHIVKSKSVAIVFMFLTLLNP